MPLGSYFAWLSLGKRRSTTMTTKSEQPDSSDEQSVRPAAQTDNSSITDGVVAAAWKATEPCYFLDQLPYEIRLEIYSYLLSDHRIIVADKKGPWRPIMQPHLRMRLRPSILAVNRQVHDEAASVLYGSNTFMMASLFWRGGVFPEGKSIYGINSRYSRYIRKIVTYTGDGTTINRTSIQGALKSAGVEFRNITMLAISFKGSVSYYEKCAQEQCILLERVDWAKLQRYIRLDGHAEWLESGKWLVYWGQR